MKKSIIIEKKSLGRTLIDGDIKQHQMLLFKNNKRTQENVSLVKNTYGSSRKFFYFPAPMYGD